MDRQDLIDAANLFSVKAIVHFRRFHQATVTGGKSKQSLRSPAFIGTTQQSRLKHALAGFVYLIRLGRFSIALEAYTDDCGAFSILAQAVPAPGDSGGGGGGCFAPASDESFLGCRAWIINAAILGLTTNYEAAATEVMLADSDKITSVQASMAGLNATTTYHFRLAAINNTGTSYGNDMTFTTSGGVGGGGGGGSGGCFIASTQSLSPWCMLLGLSAGWLIRARRRAKSKELRT